MLVRFKIFSLASLALAVVLSGCGGAASPPTAGNPATPLPPLSDTGAKDVTINASAGVPISPGDPNALQKQILSKVVVARADPFDLLPPEKAYDKSQLAASLAAGGGFGMIYQAPPEVDQTEEIEPQPYRRLAGIMIGDSVTALIDMGNGQLQAVHPGQRIQGTEWMVQSIDQEKAVLRRVGSRKKPTEVIVRLESPPFGGGNPAGTGANPVPGGAPGQPPGGVPPGRLGGGRGVGGGD